MRPTILPATAPNMSIINRMPYISLPNSGCRNSIRLLLQAFSLTKVYAKMLQSKQNSNMFKMFLQATYIVFVFPYQQQIYPYFPYVLAVL